VPLPSLRRFVALGAIAVAVSAMPSPAPADPPPAELERQIRAASEQLEVVVEEYNSLREDLRITVAQTGVLARQIAPLERRVEDLRDRVGLIAATAYRSGGMDSANVLLTAAAGHDLVRRLDALDLLARRRHREIAALGAARDRYVTARRTLDALVEQARSQETELATRRTAIERQLASLREMRLRAYGAGERAALRAVRAGYVPVIPSGRDGDVVRFALAQLGRPYRWAADGPDGYDCSGLVVAAWRSAGVTLPHSSSRQFATVRRITRSELRPADLVFYYDDVHHVGIYLGEGLMIHAPEPGATVRIDPVDHAPIHGYGRPR